MLKEEENNIEETSSEGSDQDETTGQSKTTETTPTVLSTAKSRSVRGPAETIHSAAPGSTLASKSSTLIQSGKVSTRKDDTKLPALSNQKSIAASTTSDNRPEAKDGANVRQKLTQNNSGVTSGKFNSSFDVSNTNTSVQTPTIEQKKSTLATQKSSVG